MAITLAAGVAVSAHMRSSACARGGMTRWALAAPARGRHHSPMRYPGAILLCVLLSACTDVAEPRSDFGGMYGSGGGPRSSDDGDGDGGDLGTGGLTASTGGDVSGAGGMDGTGGPQEPPDFDGDGIPDSVDPCPVDAENDADGDGVCEALDLCPFDRLDDRDGDGACDSQDPCPDDATDDIDGDGACDSDDPCPLDPQDDIDGDGQCADVDPCPLDPADDSDGDGVCDGADPCPADAPDDPDGDGICQAVDPCPLDPLNDQDGDGRCADVDPCPADAGDDSDGDGSCDSVDICPGHDDGDDGDDDGVPDGCDRCVLDDADDDGNGYPDACDVLLWEFDLGEFVGGGGVVPWGNPTAALPFLDGAYGEISRVSAPLPEASAAVSLTDVGSLSAAQNGIRSCAHVQPILESNGKSITWIRFACDRVRGAVVARVVLIGFAAADYSAAVRWEVRGYVQ